jgi:hypothetical protein
LLLPIAQLAYNNKVLELIGKTLFFANYRQHLNLFKRILLGLKVEKALANTTNMQATYNKMQQKISTAQESSA